MRGYIMLDETAKCPLCKRTVTLCRVKIMRWAYKRCPVCLLAYGTKKWNELEAKP